ncbi:hypothetical protein FD754_016327, partial [Muntiacus muntjak]
DQFYNFSSTLRDCRSVLDYNFLDFYTDFAMGFPSELRSSCRLYPYNGKVPFKRDPREISCSFLHIRIQTEDGYLRTMWYLLEIHLTQFVPREEMMLSGKYKSGEKILHLANERFAVPEIFFNPSDIGIHEMGIPEAINIVLTGGNSLFPGFRDRVYSEVRCLTPIDYDVSVGGKLISENDNFDDMVVTREDYQENGHSICEEKFDI